MSNFEFTFICLSIAFVAGMCIVILVMVNGIQEKLYSMSREQRLMEKRNGEVYGSVLPVLRILRDRERELLRGENDGTNGRTSKTNEQV